MKTIKLITAFLLVLLSLKGNSQLLIENFTNNLPSAWMQSPASSWSLSTSLDAAGSGCIYTQNISSQSDTTTISTPTLNLSGVSNLTITFKAAIVGNNFLPPNIVLSYNSGAGTQFLSRWGTGFSSNTTHTITDYGYDYQPPLDAQNVKWHNLSHTVTAVSGTTGRLMFSAELYNGGYVLLDSVVIAGQTSTVATGLTENKSYATIIVFPNPTTDKKMILEGGPLKDLFLINTLGEKFPVIYKKQQNAAIEINLNDLPAGCYYLTGFTENKIKITKKVILE